MKNSENCLQTHRNVTNDKIRQLEDTVAILVEQVESLKLELDYKNQNLLEITEELNFTNQELSILNELLTNSLAVLLIKEDKELNDLLTSENLQKVSQIAFEKIGV